MRDSKGFTLIELLVVVLIIGVIAGVTIPRFWGTKEKAFDATAQTDLRNLMVAQEAYYADHQTYVGFAAIPAGGTITTPLTFHASTGVSLAAVGGQTGYLLTAKHASSPTTWCVNSVQATNGKSRIVDLPNC